MTWAEFVAGCDWAAVRESLRAARVELQSRIEMVELDLRSMGRPPQRIIENRDGLRRTLVTVDRFLGMLEPEGG